jgi:predicted HicB family RNase H-like nuclease
MKSNAARIKKAALKALARGESLNQFVAETIASA